MSAKQNLCILSFSMIAWDSRVLRQVDAARMHYAVDVIAFGDWIAPANVRYFRLDKTKRNIWQWVQYVCLLLAGRLFSSLYERAFWMHPEYTCAKEILLREKHQLIHANDWNGLPVAVSAARFTGGGVLFDAHEYSPAEEADKPFWTFLFAAYRTYLFRTYQAPVRAMVTVSRGIRDLYEKTFGWDMSEILNAPSYRASRFRPTTNDHVRLVHHGAALPGRKLEYLIDLVSMLDHRYELALILLPSNLGYLERLKHKAAQTVPGRVHFIAPIADKAKLFDELETFDIGIPPIVARQLNDFYALPNKFFDFIMAGLALAVAPLPMMQQIVVDHEIGVVAEDQSPQALAGSLNALSANDINRYKLNSLKLAKSMNAETEQKKLLNIYERILMN